MEFRIREKRHSEYKNTTNDTKDIDKENKVALSGFGDSTALKKKLGHLYKENTRILEENFKLN